MLAVDTETTGLDPWHGTKPFLVTIASSEGYIDYWEWDVDPLTRQPKIPPKDKAQIRRTIKGQKLVFHNAKFDIRMLSTIGIKVDWSYVSDSVIAAHLLRSDKPKDLESLCLYYLGIDLSPYENSLKTAVAIARRIASKEFPDWQIAKKGIASMPSAKDKVWKYDLWLPKAVAKRLKYEKGHTWWTLTKDYANSDSESTLLLFTEMEKIIKEKNLEDIYRQRKNILPIIYEMENVGVSLSKKRLEELETQYREEANRSRNICTNIAKSIGFELSLPKSGNNKSLQEFVYDKLKLIPLKTSKKTGEPSLDAATLDYLESSLRHRSKESRFVTNLKAVRKRGTALTYMESYKRFWLHAGGDTYKLHPSVNPTGTGTLRSSSSNPNEQNISKKEGFNLRYAFGPAPGREWWSIDYDNLELRIPAYECQEPAMLDLFEKPDDPPYYGSYHLLIFSILYPDEFKKYGVEVKNKYKSTLYQWTKNGNFAELYGAVDTHDGKSTADLAFHYPGAQAIVASRLKKKSALNQYWISYAKRNGYVETMPDRTVDPDRGYPLYCTKTSRGYVKPTVPLNYRVQGTACWVKMQAMDKCHKYLKTLTDYYLIMDIHDELVFDFPHIPDRGNMDVVNKVKTLMESCGDDIGIPLTCGIDYHPNNWSTAT